jgi:hypothetical protein
MDRQQIQRTFYEFIYEMRKPEPDSPFNNRTFVIWYFAILLIIGLLEGRVSKYITFPSGTLILWFVRYRIIRPKLEIGFAQFTLDYLVSSAIVMLSLYGIYFVLKYLLVVS